MSRKNVWIGGTIWLLLLALPMSGSAADSGRTVTDDYGPDPIGGCHLHESTIFHENAACFDVHVGESMVTVGVDDDVGDQVAFWVAFYDPEGHRIASTIGCDRLTGTTVSLDIPPRTALVAVEPYIHGAGTCMRAFSTTGTVTAAFA